MDSDWTHCDPVAAVNAAAISAQVCPVNEDFHGMPGAHHASVAMLLTSEPSAATSDGNSSTLATVASFGL